MARKKVRGTRKTQSVTSVHTDNDNCHTTTTVKITSSDLSNFTKEQLKAECRKRGQKTSGTKTELIQRLSINMLNQRKDQSTSNGKAATTSLDTSSKEICNNTTTSATAATSKGKNNRDRDERESLVLWKRPLTTLYYFTMEVFTLLKTYGIQLYTHRISVSLVVISVLVIGFISKLSGPHQVIFEAAYKKLIWCLYWTGLGILSSVGLGTGLHTFLLYLGPHIAQVTLAAYECGSLNFPEPPYPDDIICPSESPKEISIFSIMSKVRLEAMCWGAGTALGELPPYFMARAARLSGIDPDDDDDLKEFEELQHKNPEDMTIIDKGKIFVEDIVQRVGFFGILACASIPNPLFDLAGITCGHFLVPFWTFFGATLIGKAIIKMHIQKLFVIIAFNETLITTALSWLNVLPIFGRKLQEPFKTFLDGQKTKLHRGKYKDGTTIQESNSNNLLSAIFEKFVFAMILYFVISIINSLAQSYHKRIRKARKLASD